jgi:trigger factor
MTDEPQPEGQEPTASVAEQTPPEIPTEDVGEGPKQEEPKKLHQTVELRDIGPCKKHIKVTVDRVDIDRLMDEQFSKLVVDTQVPGFRPGKAPRKIIERRFKKDVSSQVKGELLMQSLEQVADENDIAPLTAPNIDPLKIDIPDQGPLIYEFEVEVRPQFDLPDYKSLKIRRPIKTITDQDVLQEERRLLAPYGSLVPKPEGAAEIGDYLVADMTTRDGERELSQHKEISIRVDPRLALKDGVAEHFGERMKGAKGGETRTVDITLSDSVAVESLRGKTVTATFDIKEIKTLRLPEITHEFLHQFGAHSEEQLREHIYALLQQRLKYHQRQLARQQVLEQLAGSKEWDLPMDLLQRQARRAFNRRVMEMRSAGMSDEDIRARVRLLEQDTIRTTSQSLKEHFVLQKIAELEKLDIDETDIDDAIERIAAQNNESPRRVRARLEKEDMMEALAMELIEEMALDLILQSAEYIDVPLDKEEAAVGTVEQQAVPGEMHDPTAAPPEEEKPETPAAAEASATAESPTAEHKDAGPS